MDRALPDDVIRRGRIKRYSGIASVLLFLIIAYFALRAVISPSLQRSKIRTSIAEIGKIEETVSASGVVAPEYEQVLTSPVASNVEKVFLKSGERVKAGESILQLNKDLLLLTAQRLEDELEIQKNKKRQLSLDLQRKQIDLQASFEIQQLQTQYTQSRYDRVKHLHDIGGASDEELDLAALNIEIAERDLAQLAQQIENQQASLQADLTGLKLEISIREKKITEIERQIGLAEARAGRDGVVTWINDNIGSPVNPGDIIARVADLGSFKVEAGISDIHAGKLKVGGAIKVRIGEKILSGRIGSISPAVQSGIVSFIVELDNRSDEVLRPSIRADVFVVTSYKDDVMRVKNGPFYMGSFDQKVFVVRGDKAVGKTVNIGISNFDWVEIQGVIAPGDEVIISVMQDCRHMVVGGLRDK